MDLAIGSTSSLHSVQDPTGAPPAQPKTEPSAAEAVAESGRRTDEAQATEKPEPRAEAAPRETRAAPPPPPADSGRGQLVDIAA